MWSGRAGVDDNNVTTTPDRGTSTDVATLEPANHRDRVAASGLDLLLVLLAGALTLTIASNAGPDLRLGLTMAAVGLPTMLVEGALGRSLGKAGLGLRHDQPDADGHPLTLAQTAGRFVLKWLVPTALAVVGLWFAALAWWVALYLPALGPARRTAHDRLTRSVVLGATERQRAEGA